MQRQQAQQRLAQTHPDFVDVVKSGDFADWIKGSKVRTELFQRADRFDFDAANELLSTYKQLKSVKQKVDVPAEEKEARTKAMQSVAVDTGGSGDTGKKVYRRADLIRLKLRDPSKYESMQDEIDLAYRQGRVK
jgi:hypothetical protein